MFTPPEFLPATIEGGAQVGRKSFRQKEFAFAQRAEGNCAGRIGAFLKHRLVPVFSSVEFGQRDSTNSARERPKLLREILEGINL
jgi:hypothetical protein